MNYLLHVGREPALALSEVLFLGSSAGITISIEWVRDGLALISCSDEPEFLHCDVLGGTIKVIEPVGIVEGDVIESIVQLLEQHKPEGKVTFGLNGWFGTEVDGIAIRVKRSLKEAGRSVRYVQGTNNQLDAATVLNNNLLTSGGDLHIISHENQLLLGRTLSVQNIDAWSLRDFEKPHRDSKRGMLPPKLARIMINMSTAHESGRVFDPFCGVGTISMEAGLLGFETLASDADPAAIAATKENMRWLEELSDGLPAWDVLQADARTVRKRVTFPISTIVSESFLGNANDLTHAQRKQEIDGLRDLYLDSLKNWRSLLHDGDRVVLAIPLFVTKQGILQVSIDHNLKRLGYRIMRPLINIDDVEDELSPLGNLLYGRSHQRVLREIIIFECI